MTLWILPGIIYEFVKKWRTNRVQVLCFVSFDIGPKFAT